MKILTLNTHSWIEEEQDRKFNILVNNIISEKYDIIFLQEVNQNINSKIIQNIDEYTVEIAKLKEDNFGLLLKDKLLELGIEYYYIWDSSHIGYDKYDEGVGILSINPILDHRSFIVSKDIQYDNYKTRKVIAAKVEHNEKTIWTFSLHLSWWDNNRFKTEWTNLLKYLEILKGNIFILAGDFNNNAYENGYDLVLKEGFYDAYALADEKIGEHTVEDEIDGWAGDSTKKRIDFVFLSRELKVNKYEIVFKGEEKVSDHYGIKIELNI